MPFTQMSLSHMMVGAGYLRDDASAVLTTPAGGGNVMSTTGALATIGEYVAYVVISTDVATAFNIQHRNAADAANVWEQRIFSAASNDRELVIPFTTTVANQRLRVTNNAAYTGNAQATIWWRRVV